MDKKGVDVIIHSPGGSTEATEKADGIAKNLADHKKYLSHGRPIGINEAKKIGVKVTDLRDNQNL